eukprot:TRINITY_DN14256_c0_g1_i1.p1 TRINITY_DN14256_c0_g1~~TRINITY_DN14256_c0_g1_i1.p1  ORF type:complete len:633 (+),score=62.81 TRINITY_DN14256_c0_g1_i1:280-2178(+)
MFQKYKLSPEFLQKGLRKQNQKHSSHEKIEEQKSTCFNSENKVYCSQKVQETKCKNALLDQDQGNLQLKCNHLLLSFILLLFFYFLFLYFLFQDQCYCLFIYLYINNSKQFFFFICLFLQKKIKKKMNRFIQVAYNIDLSTFYTQFNKIDLQDFGSAEWCEEKSEIVINASHLPQDKGKKLIEDQYYNKNKLSQLGYKLDQINHTIQQKKKPFLLIGSQFKRWSHSEAVSPISKHQKTLTQMPLSTVLFQECSQKLNTDTIHSPRKQEDINNVKTETSVIGSTPVIKNSMKHTRQNLRSYFGCKKWQKSAMYQQKLLYKSCSLNFYNNIFFQQKKKPDNQIPQYHKLDLNAYLSNKFKDFEQNKSRNNYTQYLSTETDKLTLSKQSQHQSQENPTATSFKVIPLPKYFSTESSPCNANYKIVTKNKPSTVTLCNSKPTFQECNSSYYNSNNKIVQKVNQNVYPPTKKKYLQKSASITIPSKEHSDQSGCLLTQLRNFLNQKNDQKQSQTQSQSQSQSQSLSQSQGFHQIPSSNQVQHINLNFSQNSSNIISKNFNKGEQQGANSNLKGQQSNALHQQYHVKFLYFPNKSLNSSIIAKSKVIPQEQHKESIGDKNKSCKTQNYQTKFQNFFKI